MVRGDGGTRGGGVASQADVSDRRAPSTQPSQRVENDQSSQALLLLSDEETNKLVAEVMRYMLFKNHQQPGVPVRREELTQLITKSYKQRYLPNTVIGMAQKKLLDTFGFEMKEYHRIRSSKGAKSSAMGDIKEYVLRSNVPEVFLRKYVESPSTAAIHSLTVLVVGIIKFSGGERVPEEILWQNLQRLGIREEEQNHPAFGNIKTALDALAKQRYIQKEKLTGSDGEGYVFELAERALDESFQSRLDEFMSKIVTRDRP